MIVVRILWLMALLFGVCSEVPDLLDYNPLKESGYTPKTPWLHFYPQNEISASVADFASPDKPCVRLVLFTGKGTPMDFVQVSCSSDNQLLGLMFIDNALWYYGIALVKDLGVVDPQKIRGKTTKFVVVKRKEDLITCKKTVWIVVENPPQPNGITSLDSSDVRSDVADGDYDCKNLVQLNIPPMIMLSAHGDVGNFQVYGFSINMNVWDPVGAKTRMLMSGLQCFRLLTFYSFGRHLDSMKVACGPLQGVVMTKNAFYYGTTAMIKIHDDDKNTFTLFMNPSNGKRRSTSADAQESPVCVKKTFRLVKKGNKYKRKKISEVKEYELGSECKDFIEGTFPGKNSNEKILSELIFSLEKNKPGVDSEILAKLDGYKLNSKRSDFNLAHELGTVILFYEGENPDDKLKLILVVAKGTLLAGTVLLPASSSEIVIRGDRLYHGTDIMVKKDSENQYTVLVDLGDGCTKTTYELKKSHDNKIIKEQSEKETLDESQGDCKTLVEGADLKHPDGDKYNTKETVS